MPHVHASLPQKRYLSSEALEETTGAIGFTVGALADYDFQLAEYATDIDLSECFVDWTYDAFGRKVAETAYDGIGMVTAQTLYVWDGWRLVSELDGLNGIRALAEYVPGPGYMDDIVASRRDQNRDGDFEDANEGFLYYLTDQQHSTVALLDDTGTVVERYGYDAFGGPSFYDGSGAPIAASAVGNNHLYTGREWQPGLGVYDYRQRMYNPATGRFLTTDPANDAANLGNPYTYVGNNPGTFVDPFGEERWGAQSYFADVADVGYGYFIGGPLEIVTGTASAIWNYDQTASGLASLGRNLYNDFGGTTSCFAASFYAQFEDSDTTGQATFGAATLAAPGAAGAAKAAAATANTGRGLITAARAARGAAAVEMGIARQAAIRGRVLANIENSQAARAASAFDVHLATEEIYANANKAATAAKEAGLTNKNGALGMRAHKEFARLNAATREDLAGRGIWIEIEPYVNPSGELVRRSAKDSLSIDTLLQYRGTTVRGFDLKTGRPWSHAGLLERGSRFRVPIQQIQH